MSLASYRKRVLSNGVTMAQASSMDTKIQQVDYILNSPSRSDVLVNMDESVSYPCIVSDTKTFQLRRFLFMPDTKVYMGDYICHDGFIYLVTDQTTDTIFPQCFAQVCNFDYPIKTVTSKILIGKKADGSPNYKTETTTITKPAVLTENNYTVIDDNPIPLPDSTLRLLLPYLPNEIPIEINKIIKNRESQYKVVDYIDGRVFKFCGVEKGCYEIKLDRVQRS